jgi:transcription antitermination protein NusB
MNTLRHHSRSVAFQLLYRFDLENSQGTELPTAPQVVNELEKHFAHFEVDPKAQSFSRELITGVMARFEELNAIIVSKAKNWKLSRIDPVDRTLLRMGLFELKYSPELATAIAIDEAIELAKQFGTADSASFINGILDSAAKDFKK